MKVKSESEVVQSYPTTSLKNLSKEELGRGNHSAHLRSPGLN